MTAHDADLMADINIELSDGNWPDALLWALELEEGGAELHTKICQNFRIVLCPHCEGKSDDEWGGCPCCDACHYIEEDTLLVWRRDPRNPENDPNYDFWDI